MTGTTLRNEPWLPKKPANRRKRKTRHRHEAQRRDAGGRRNHAAGARGEKVPMRIALRARSPHIKREHHAGNDDGEGGAADVEGQRQRKVVALAEAVRGGGAGKSQKERGRDAPGHFGWTSR
jgi:hypothetical protein